MKNFTFNITIKIATLLFVLSGCSTTTEKISSNRREVSGVKDIQVEQNVTLVIEDRNRTETEIVDVEDIEHEQNNTIEVINFNQSIITMRRDINNTREEVTHPIAIAFPTPTPTPTPTSIPMPTPTSIPIHRPTPIVSPTPLPTPVIEEEIDYTKTFINEENCNQILDKEFLIICYDFDLKVAKSVAYTLYGDLVNEVDIEDRPSFYIEQDIEPQYRAKTTDYTHSGYDRGHLAPDASFDWSKESLKSTYSLANIIPQAPVVNRQLWLKAENYARDKAIELLELNVINVVKYSSTPQYIGENNISVSVGFYKILFNSDKEYEECFYYANDLNATSEDDHLENHLVDCSKINY